MEKELIKYLENNLIIFDNAINEEEIDAVHYDKHHIFYSVLIYLASKYGNENLIDYIYFYNQYEKLLNQSRENNLNIGIYYINKIKNLHKNYEYKSDLVKNGLDSLYHPAIAYYYYFVTKEYNLAEYYILESLKNIDFLISNGFKDGIFMKIEQWLNTFRVYYNMGNEDKAMFYSTEVLSYILGEDNSLFQIPFREVQQYESQLTQILDLFFNGVIFKVLSTSSGKAFFNNIFLLQILENLKNRDYNKNLSIHNSINIMYLILTNNKSAVSEILNTNIFTQEIPKSIRYFILKFLIKELNFDLLEEKIKDQIIQYEKNELLLKKEYITENSCCKAS